MSIYKTKSKFISGNLQEAHPTHRSAAQLRDNRPQSIAKKELSNKVLPLQLKGKININDDKGLEKEADVMGNKALQRNVSSVPLNKSTLQKNSLSSVAQRAAWEPFEEGEKWDELIDGVQWYAHPDGLMWFEVIRPRDVMQGKLSDYMHLEGKRKTWAEWNKISVDPHPVPHEPEFEAPDLSEDAEQVMELLSAFETQKTAEKSKIGDGVTAFFKKAAAVKMHTKKEHPYVIRVADFTLALFAREKGMFKFLDSAASLAKKYATGKAMVQQQAYTPMDDWASPETLKAKSFGAGMGEGGYSHGKDKKYILGSGGAGDCVVIIAYNSARKKGFVVHAHRLTSLELVAGLINSSVGAGAHIYLASQMFGKNGGADSELINNVKKMITTKGYALKAVYASSSLAINLANGEVRPGVNASALGGAADVNEGDRISLQYMGKTLDF